jgi:hypothetical protein
VIVIRAKEVGADQLAESNAYETPPFAYLDSAVYGVGDAVSLADPVVIANNANTTVAALGDGGYSVEKTGGVNGAYDASAVSALGCAGDFILRIKNIATGEYMVGMNTDPTTDNNYTSIDYWWAFYGGLYWQTNGGANGMASAPFAWIWRTGTNLYFGTGATFEDVLAAPNSVVADVVATLYFDSSLFATGAKFEAHLLIPKQPMASATIFARTSTTVTERAGRWFRIANTAINLGWSADAISGPLPTDFLIRCKPERRDVWTIFGVTAAPTTSAANTELEAAGGRAIKFSDTGTVLVADAGAATSYGAVAAGEYFFLERIGSTVKGYRGPTTDLADATPFHTFTALTGTQYFDCSFIQTKFTYLDVHVGYASTNRGSADPLTVYRSLTAANSGNEPTASPDDWAREGAIYSEWSSSKFYAIGDRVADSAGMMVYEALDGGAEAIVTISIASPGVVTWPAHGLEEGDKVSFQTTGALPTGLTADAVYFVKALTADTFKLAATSGGADINTSGTQSGAHLARGNPNINRQPSENPELWVAIGPTNRWAMFDNVVGTATRSANYLDFTLELEGVADSLALLEMANAVSVQIIVTVDPEGEVYNETFDLTSTAGIGDWYTYFSEEIERETNLLLTDLPSFSNPTVQVIIIGSGTAELAVGLFAIGAHFNLGRTLHDGASVGIFDYSRKEVDDFGNVTIVERAYSKRGSFQTLIDKPRVDAVQAVLASLRATPAVYSASEDYDATLIFGFAKDFQIEIAYPNESLLSLEIEGLT